MRRQRGYSSRGKDVEREGEKMKGVRDWGGGGDERLSAENGIGGYCSVTLSIWENKDIL